jgi:hypothetical protein
MEIERRLKGKLTYHKGATNGWRKEKTKYQRLFHIILDVRPYQSIQPQSILPVSILKSLTHLRTKQQSVNHPPICPTQSANKENTTYTQLSLKTTISSPPPTPPPSSASSQTGSPRPPTPGSSPAACSWHRPRYSTAPCVPGAVCSNNSPNPHPLVLPLVAAVPVPSAPPPRPPSSAYSAACPPRQSTGPNPSD